MGRLICMHNYKTVHVDLREYPETDEEAVQYIPQDVAAQGLYQCHRELGRSVAEASGRVLAASLGREWPEDTGST